jgi:PST family polysaccharide transporter
MAYLFAGSMASKVISFGSQIALTHLLLPADFGVVSLAFTVTVLIQVVEQTGVGDVLLRRKRFHLWAVASFWLALVFGLVGCLLFLVAAPIAAWMYGNPQLAPLLLVLAPSSLANALTAVPRAQLGRDLRFRFLAALNFISGTMRMVLTVALAAIGFGPYSFVVPVPLTALAVAGFLWWWVKPPLPSRLHLPRWRYLVGDSTRLLAADMGRAIFDQLDYIMLGLFRSVSIVGIYTVGFNFSIQMLQLLTVNLTNILFPALTKLNDHPQAQLAGFLKAQRILALFGISSCFLQSAIAEPITYLLLDAKKWSAAIVVMQVLSIGMATRMLVGSSFALLKSQGRFQTILWTRWSFLAVQFIGLAIALGLGGNEASVAVAVAAVSTVMGPITLYAALRPYGTGWSTVFEVICPPLVCGISSVGAAWLLAQQMAASGYGYLPQLIVTVVVAVILTAVMARLWMRPVWDDLWARIWRLMGARFGV